MSNNQSIIESKKAIPLWRDERVLKILAQVVSAILVIGFVVWAVINFFKAADARGLELGFDFLSLPAGFPISDPAIEYTPSDVLW